MASASASKVGYEPSPEFEQNAKDSLIELDLTDSSELWLIQWPINQPPDFDGQEVTLKLHHEGHLGSFEGSSGKSYDVVSFASQHPDATVFSSSASKSKFVGKISRRVSLIHYPEPDELQKLNPNNLKQMYERHSATLTNSSHRFATPTQSTRSRHFQSGSGLATSSRGSGRRSFLFASEDPSKEPNRRRSEEQLAQASDQGHNVVASSGSLGHSQEKKSKKKRKTES